MQRLDKILSDANIASRKELKTIIRAGRVQVNGQIIKSPEAKADAQTDEILVDAIPIRKPCRLVVLIHKPAGYVTSTDDPRDPTVMELLPPQYRGLGLTPVGRLDKETEGLLLFTNDGQLAHHIISPKHQVQKTYYAEHEGTATAEDVEAFSSGMTLRDGSVCLPAILEPLGAGKSRITLCQGMYHQVRRMMAARGMHVLYLRREAEGTIDLSGLEKGSCRELSAEEIGLLER